MLYQNYRMHERIGVAHGLGLPSPCAILTHSLPVISPLKTVILFGAVCLHNEGPISI
jgi:hypothetical protein